MTKMADTRQKLPSSDLLERKEIAKERRIETFYEQILEEPDLLKQQLLPLELWCLQTILGFQKPMNTREFYKLQLDRVFRENFDLHHRTTRKRYYKKHDKSIFAAGFSETDKTRKQEKWLRDEKIKFPSYPKILNTLRSLEGWHMIKRRHDDVKKMADFYWILDVKFYFKVKPKLRQIVLM